MSEQSVKRGDLIVVERIERNYVIGQGASEQTRFDVMEVSGLFRDGRVRTVRSVAWSDNSPGQQVQGRHRMLGLVQTYLVPHQIDREAAIEAVRAHRWPGHEHEEWEMIRPFDSLDEIRALLRPFLLVAVKPDSKTDEPRCPECVDVGSNEDPLPWCDCRNDETCKGPCRRRAHDPHRCPARSIPS